MAEEEETVGVAAVEGETSSISILRYQYSNDIHYTINFDNLKHDSNWAMTENPSSIAWCCNVMKMLLRKAAPFCARSPNRRKRKYIDIWLVDFFSEPDGVINDRKHLFMLQVL